MSSPSLGHASVYQAQTSLCIHVRNTDPSPSVSKEDLLFLGQSFKLLCVYSSLVPCPPTNVTATHTCAPSPVPVTWVASQGAKYYTAVAVSGGGHRSECTANETSCSLAGLQCGEVYTIGVSSADDDCAGQQSQTVSLNTGKTTRKTTRKVLLLVTDASLTV